MNHPAIQQRIDVLEDQLSKLECNHEGQRLIRYRLASNGPKMLKVQCTRCGELLGDWIPHSKVQDVEAIKPIDDELGTRYRQNKSDLQAAINEQLRKLEKDDFFKAYAIYLASPEWAAKRLAVLKRCGGVCEGCRKNRATIAHHLSYAHVYHEFLFELVGVCQECHDSLHPVDEDEK